MSKGFVLLHRRVVDSQLWNDKPFARGQAWIDLLLSAAHKPHSFWARGVEVKVSEGQVAMSELTMAERWGWSRGKVRRFLSYLEGASKIVQQKNNVTTLITIEKWKQYQRNNTAERHQTDTRRTPDGTQSTMTINDNNVNKKREGHARHQIPPKPKDVAEYCRERKNGINAERFCDYYAARGWELKKGQRMKDWQAAVRTWEKGQEKTQDVVPVDKIAHLRGLS